MPNPIWGDIIINIVRLDNTPKGRKSDQW